MKRTIPVVLLAGSLAFAACGSTSKASSNSGAATTTTTAPSTTTVPTSSTGTTGTTGAVTGTGGVAAYTGSTSADITEAGSTLEYPYYETIETPFKTAFPKLTLEPGPGGSGQGLSEAVSGAVDFGGSDAYISPADMTADPGLINVPLVVSSQAVDYNLPGVTGHLKLTGNLLAEMYEGTITNWDNSAIKAINPGVTLPNLTIHPIHRSDSSGDSFLFTSLLSATNATWASKIGENELPTWPSAPGASSAMGNPGMALACKGIKGCVAYIGISEEKDALAMGLSEAELQNKAGNYELPSSTTVDSAVTASLSKIPSDLAVSLIYASGADSYPDVNFEYALVEKKQSSANAADALRTLFDWIISTTGGSQSAYLSANQFQALPTAVIPRVKAAIASITG